MVEFALQICKMIALSQKKKAKQKFIAFCYPIIVNDWQDDFCDQERNNSEQVAVVDDQASAMVMLS